MLCLQGPCCQWCCRFSKPKWITFTHWGPVTHLYLSERGDTWFNSLCPSVLLNNDSGYACCQMAPSNHLNLVLLSCSTTIQVMLVARYGTKQSPEPPLTYHQGCQLTVTQGGFHTRYPLEKCLSKIISLEPPRDQWVNRWRIQCWIIANGPRRNKLHQNMNPLTINYIHRKAF